MLTLKIGCLFVWIKNIRSDFFFLLEKIASWYFYRMLQATRNSQHVTRNSQFEARKARARAVCVKIMGKGCEKCVKKRNHVKSMLAKIHVHHIRISHACELFDKHVKFCSTCEKFLSYLWTFFPCILFHMKSFHTCETILSCMWNLKFTCLFCFLLYNVLVVR